MKKIYLNEKLKEYYSDSLLESIECSNEFWDLDDGLENHLLSINKSENIRTIYSKRGTDLANNLFESYLVFGYTKKIEKKLLDKIIPKILTNYNIGRSNCSLNLIEPHKQPEREKNEHNNGMRCITESDYFNINQIRITLKDKSYDLHDKFWKDLNKTLSKL